MKLPLVSCIVVTYNSEKYIKSCLTALSKVNYKNLEIILVDNQSTDKTISVAQKFGKNVKLISNPKNDGYAGGHSLGIQHSTAKYVFLLNPDTVVTPDFLLPMVEVAEGNSKIAAVQPAVYLAKKTKSLNLTGKVTHYLGFDWLRDYEATTLPQSGEIISFSGSGVLLKISAYKSVGGLDANYFMYYEDSDLGWRLRMNGFSIWFCAESIIYHDYKFIPDETYQSLKQKLFWAERNRLYTFFKNYELSTLVLLLPIFIFMEFSLLVYFLTKGWLGTKLKSYVSLWQVKNQLLKSRKKVQKQRTLNDRFVASQFKSRMDFSLFDHPVIKYIINPLLLVYWKLIWPLV